MVVILAGECTALLASQQHANLAAVVQRTAVYPAKLMRGGSFACVHDTVYMYVKLESSMVCVKLYTARQEISRQLDD